MPSSFFKHKSVDLEHYWRAPNSSVAYSIWDRHLNTFKEENMKPFDPYYELYLLKIMNPEIDRQGNVLVPGLGYLDDNSFHRYRDIRIPRVIHRESLSGKKAEVVDFRSNCTPMVLDQPGAGVYGHTLIDLIPKILSAQKILNCSDFPLILMKSNHNRVLPLFNHFGINPERLVDVDRDIYKLKELRVVSSFIQGVNSRFPFSDLLPVRNLVQTGTNKVWFSRTHLSGNQNEKRILTNRVEVERLIQNFGFEMVYPEEISLDDISKIVQSAKVLAGESGSALHNILLGSARDVKLLAVSGAQDFVNQIACTNSARGKFFGFNGDFVKGSTEYYVDPLNFRKAIETLLEQ
jgi:hypothetical protein